MTAEEDLINKIAECLSQGLPKQDIPAVVPASIATEATVPEETPEASKGGLVNLYVEELIKKIEMCIDYQSLFALEESFNKCGLTVQTTARNRTILCKLREGKPVTEKIIEDYIFLGSLNTLSEEISEISGKKICLFIRENAGPAGKVENMARSWQNGLRVYESKLLVVDEGMQEVVGDI